MAKTRKTRQNATREHLAYLAARLMAEDGIQDFGAAKRKAARQAGISDTQNLPGNLEIEAALRAYQALYQSEAQPAALKELREIALTSMEILAQFQPYLIGSVLTGTANEHSDVNLQLFADSCKEVEMFLLGRNMTYEVSSKRAWLGDRQMEIPVLTFEVDGVAVALAVYDRDHERVLQKHRSDGRSIERAKIAEVRALLVKEARDATQGAAD
jgi:hypothetical protein